MPDRDIQVKIGVFFCSCGLIMNDYFDLKALSDYASGIPGVTHVETNRFLCTKSGCEWLKTKIAQSGCNRVVVVGCSPILHEQKFMNCIEETGLNRYFLSIANIREGCAWVIPERDKLMSRARQIIIAAVRRVKFAKPAEKIRKKMNRSALVIGAGIAGVQTALELQKLGIRPFIVEKKPQVSQENPVFLIPYNQKVNAREMFSSKIREIREKNIDLLTSTQVKDVKGNVGSFQVVLDNMGQEKVLEVGSIVVSTGFRRQGGEQISALRSSRRIVSLSQLRNMLDFERRTLERILLTQDKRTKYTCFILSDSEESPKTDTVMALNEALTLKEQFKTEIFIAAEDITVSGTELESLYRLAREKGVLFFRYSKDSPPEFSLDKGIITVRLKDPALAKDVKGENVPNIALCSDLLVLEDEILPSEGTKILGDILQVNLNQWGFFQEKNINFQRNLSNRKGIFFTGSCLGEEDIYDTFNDVRSVAMGICSFLSGDYMELEKKVDIDTDRCVLCLTCYRSCPHKAIEIGETDGGRKRAARVIVEACQGCGICAGECPAKD
ncbi:MAG: FAD-dependent oxidoreductase [bacterium]